MSNPIKRLQRQQLLHGAKKLGAMSDPAFRHWVREQHIQCMYVCRDVKHIMNVLREAEKYLRASASA